MTTHTRAGDRLKGLRELIGFKQAEMAELLGVDLVRYKNVETKKAKMAEDEFNSVCRSFPEFCHYLTFEGEIDLEALHKSNEKLVKLAAAAIEAGKIPEGYFLKERIK